MKTTIRAPRTGTVGKMTDAFWNWFWDGYEGGGINDQDSDAPGNVAHRSFRGAMWSPFCDWMSRAFVEGYKRGQRAERSKSKSFAIGGGP